MWLEYLRIARTALGAHRFRSALTVLSITIGAFSIVAMSSLAASGLRSLRRGVEELGGARMLFVERKQPERAVKKVGSWSKGITLQDRDAVFAAVPYLVGKAMYASLWRKEVRADSGDSANTSVVAADGGTIPMFRMRLHAGRSFTEEENRQYAKVCVVGWQLAQELWQGDALGRWLSLVGTRCRVIGVLADQERWGINMGFDWRDVVFAPYSTLASVEPRVAQEAALIMTTDHVSHNEVVKRILNALLTDRHNGVDDFQLFDMSNFLEQFEKLFGIMSLIVTIIAGIALLVGGIGVMNMMLVSVSERVREIGIRKAIGATPRDIAAQFLCEAVLLSGIGGAIGVLLGIGVALLAGLMIGRVNATWITVVAYGAVAAALGVALTIGVVFGFVPARRASRLPAIEAMRR